MQDLMPEGWYHAEGDPAGTQRWWDGTTWHGGPVAVATSATAAPVPDNLANWGRRALAALIDLALFIPSFVFAGVVDDNNPLVDTTMENVSFGLIGLTFLITILNVWIMQGITGQSLGKRIIGTRLIRERDGEPIGVGLMFVRLLVVALLTTFSCYLYRLVDYLWPAFDPKSQRVTDKMLSTLVVNVRP